MGRSNKNGLCKDIALPKPKLRRDMLGRKISLEDVTGGVKGRTGTVIAVYPWFVVCDTGKYKECVNG